MEPVQWISNLQEKLMFNRNNEIVPLTDGDLIKKLCDGSLEFSDRIDLLGEGRHISFSSMKIGKCR